MNIVKSQIEVLAPTNMYSIIPTQKKNKGQMDKVYYYYGNLIFFLFDQFVDGGSYQIDWNFNLSSIAIKENCFF